MNAATAIPPMTTEHNMPLASLPALPLWACAIGFPVLVTGFWCGICAMTNTTSETMLLGVIGPGIVLVYSVIALAIFRPSKQRAVNVLPFIWMGTSFGRTLVTLLTAFLLYSAATPYSQQRMLFVAVGGALLAVLVSETLVYVKSLPRLAAGQLDDQSPTSVE